jgi:hypothetical protein
MVESHEVTWAASCVHYRGVIGYGIETMYICIINYTPTRVPPSHPGT